MFIGAEGTLGIVTKASVLTPKRPKVNLLFSLKKKNENQIKWNKWIDC